MGDKYNRFDWKLLDNRFEMANYLSSLINYRNKFNIIENVKTIEENNIFINYDNGCLGILINSNITKDNTDKLFVINPSNKDTIIYFDSVAKLFLNDSGLVENSDEITFYNLKSNTCGGFILNEK